MSPPDHEPVLVLGACSDIGRAIARAYAAAGRPLLLAARNVARLDGDQADLTIRHGVPVTIHEFDVLDTGAHERFLDDLGLLPATVVCVVGLLGDQDVMQRDFEAAGLVMRTNYLGPASILGAVANRMEARGSGTIIGISSVAGERGRARNYIYGSAKAGLTAYLSGLRARMAGAGVHVVTVKPGFVETQMTAGMRLPPLLTARPAEVARAVLAAERRRAGTIYVRALWRALMAIIRALPEPLFVRLRF